jgi:type I restriction enzyme M protein
VRQKLVETGAVDVMIDVRSNFFYTRTVPCQLWFFDRAKEKDEARRDHVLMIDARQIFRKASRSVCDFSPEQQKNIAAIVWLYRGQQVRFLELVESYLAEAVTLGAKAQRPLETYEEALGKLADLMEPFVKVKRKYDPLAGPWDEVTSAQETLTADIEAFDKEATKQGKARAKAACDNAGLNAVRAALHPLADRCRDLTKQIDVAVKLAGRVIDIAVKELGAREADEWNNGEVNKARKALDEARAAAVESLRQARYFVKQADWLQERFPGAVLRGVEGLVKCVNRSTIEEHDWSLTPGRYVGVAPQEKDEDFDFEEAFRAIHVDLKGLNEEAEELAARIAKNFEELSA